MSKHPPSKKARERQLVPRAIEVELSSLEVASGYDGLLRGAPEPVIIVAAYSVDAEGPPRTLLRSAFRVPMTMARIPVTIPTRLRGVPPVRSASVAADHVLLVAAGVEDDGGEGPGKVFGALEHADKLALASVDLGVDLEALADLGQRREGWRSAQRALVVIDGLPLAARCPQDDWVGSSAVLFPTRPRTREHRMHLVSDDGRNDWTAVLLTRFAF